MSSLLPVFRNSFGSTIDRDLDRLFDTFFGAYPTRYTSNTTVTQVPKANVNKDAEGYAISLAAPGLTRDAFSITVENNVLTISSSDSDEVMNDDNILREYSYSSFSRSWTLPEGSNTSQIAARYEAGILNVMIPVDEKASSSVTINID